MYLNKINQYINLVHLGGAPAIASASGAFVAGNDAKSVAAHKPPADEISKGRSDSTEALADSYWKVQRMMEEAALEKPSPAPTCKDTGSEKSEDAKSALTSGSGHEGKELGGDQGETGMMVMAFPGIPHHVQLPLRHRHADVPLAFPSLISTIARA